MRTTLQAKLGTLPLTGIFVVASLVLLPESPALADSETAPPPASVGADVPVTYFGPAPSSVEPELIGPRQLLTAGQVDLTAGTVKLPLYQGHLVGTDETVWFILTDTSDRGQAEALGINYSAKLEYAATSHRRLSSLARSVMPPTRHSSSFKIRALSTMLPPLRTM